MASSSSQMFVAMATAVTLACLVCPVQTDLFTAIVNLEKLLYAENQVALDIRNYIVEEEERLDELRKVANDYEKHSREALSNVNTHLANPLNGFLLVKRFTTDWDRVVTLIKNNSAESFMQSMSDTLENFPDEEDLSGAATALLRLQDTYALPTEKIANGELQGVKESPALSAEDCFSLGRMAYNQGDHYHTILWLEQALEQEENEVNKTMERSMILDYLAYSTYVQGNTRHALEYTNELLMLEPDHVRAKNNKRYYDQMLAEEEEARSRGDAADAPTEFKNERQLDDYRAGHEFQQYEALCRDEEPVKRDTNRLTCRYKRHHPVFYIQPLKEETMNMDPWIVVYHDFIRDHEIEKLKSLASPRLKRATVQNPQTGNLETAFYRVSKSAWLRDEEHRLVDQMSLRVQALTNLTMSTAEELQVVNYGLGGHYEPHFDFARKEEIHAFDPNQGNRIATALCYMSDVPAGGATVFTYIGVKLWPVKGSCAFWYNLKESGEGDYMTRHAACPVLTGSKWVCNKWIHERGQELLRPCALDPEK